jgi:hypothetical protein
VGAIREIVGERLADVSIATLALAADRACPAARGEDDW